MLKSVKYLAILALSSTILMATDKDALHFSTKTKSYRPPAMPVTSTPERTYPEYVESKGQLYFDPEKNLMVYSETCSVVCPLSENNYLTAAGVVQENSYQWAKFTSRDSLTDQSRWGSVFKLVEDGPTTYRIQCNYGEASYLAVNSSGGSSFRWAFFASDAYLESDPSKYCSRFNIESLGLDYIGIKFKDGDLPLYLALNDPILTITSRWAVFTSINYMDVNTSRELGMLKLYAPLSPHNPL